MCFARHVITIERCFCRKWIVWDINPHACPFRIIERRGFLKRALKGIAYERIYVKGTLRGKREKADTLVAPGHGCHILLLKRHAEEGANRLLVKQGITATVIRHYIRILVHYENLHDAAALAWCILLDFSASSRTLSSFRSAPHFQRLYKIFIRELTKLKSQGYAKNSWDRIIFPRNICRMFSKVVWHGKWTFLLYPFSLCLPKAPEKVISCKMQNPFLKVSIISNFLSTL